MDVAIHTTSGRAWSLKIDNSVDYVEEIGSEYKPPAGWRLQKKRLTSSVYMRRNVRRMTQAELAQAVGVSRQSISLIESWKQVPSVDVALAIAEALDSTVDELFSLR